MADKRGANKSAEAKVVCLAPDVCLTPMGSSMVPVAYTIESRFNVAEMTAKAVNFGGLPVFNMGSHLPKVTGDERGVGGGIISGVNMGCCKPIPGSHSNSLRIEGEWLVRHGDLMEMNCSGPKGKGNTFGKIDYIDVKPMASVDANGQIVVVEEKVSTDPKTGEPVVRRTEERRDPATGQITKKTETTFTDPETGETVVQSTEVTRDPVTGQVTSATEQHTIIDPATGQIQTEKLSMAQDPRSGDLTRTAATGDFDRAQNNYEWHQESETLSGRPALKGPVLDNNAIGTQDAFGRTYLGDGLYANSGNTGNFPPPSSDPDLPPDIADDDPELLHHPEYRDAVANEQAALREIERINREMAWEAAKTAADLAGLVDPTPISDTVGGLMALKDGDFLGAGLSLLSWVPYAGDAIAKPIKGSRTAAKAAKLAKKLQELTAKLDKLKDATKKAKERVKQLLKDKRAPNKTPEVQAPKKSAGVNGGTVKGKSARAKKKEQLKKNRENGRRREKEVSDELKAKHPDASVQNEQYLRDADGKIVKDPVTGEARRIDHVVIKDGKVIETVETTSMTVDKSLQIAKEMRIRSTGGNFIRDRVTGKLIDLGKNPPSTVVHKP
jgi:hypothetical protein